MIKKFLYELNIRNRKVLTHIIENNDVTDVDYEKTYDVLNVNDYHEAKNEMITDNTGPHYYIRFHADNKYKYLDIAINKDGVKLQLTDNLAFAACYSQNFMEVIMDNCSQFGYQDYTLIKAFSGINKKGEKTDGLEKVLKKLSEDSYCQINKDNESFFIGLDQDEKFCLTKDFDNAVKIPKNNIRKVLVINGFIDDTTKRSDLAFSPYNYFVFENTRTFANKVSATFEQDQLLINHEGKIASHRIVNDKEKYEKLHKLYQVLNLPTKETKGYISCNDRYVKEIQGGFCFIENPSQASLMDDTQIEIFKAAIALFIDNPKIYRFESNLIYLYQVDNTYEFSQNSSSYKGNIIFKQTYDKFVSLILKNKVMNQEGNLLILDNKYLRLEIINDDSFKMLFLETAYHATLFTNAQYDVIVELFRFKSSKKEIINYFDAKKFKIGNNVGTYQEIIDKINSNKFRVKSSDYDIKTETEKGALEYLRLFYNKNLFDYKILFNRIKNMKDVTNILIVGTTSNLEIIALEEVFSNVKISTLDDTRCGYYVGINISNNIYQKHYRADFNQLPKNILKRFDCIVFSKGFHNINLNQQLELFINDSKEVILANLKSCNLGNKEDSFYDFFSQKSNIKRKYFNNDEQKISDLNMLGKSPQLIEPIFENKHSYCCLVKIHRNEVIDLLKK